MTTKRRSSTNSKNSTSPKPNKSPAEIADGVNAVMISISIRGLSVYSDIQKHLASTLVNTGSTGSGILRYVGKFNADATVFVSLLLCQKRPLQYTNFPIAFAKTKASFYILESIKTGASSQNLVSILNILHFSYKRLYDIVCSLWKQRGAMIKGHCVSICFYWLLLLEENCWASVQGGEI